MSFDDYVLTEEIRHYLTAFFAPLGIDPDATYLNEIADVIDEDVVSVRTLVEEAEYWVEREEVPTYDQGLIGFFNAPATFDPASRVRGLRLSDFERAIDSLLLSRR
ncbi:hypothetical protein [Pseudomonas guariconensis]|uniref:hypothetical protein n=1 Tax=Pseudomonas guariconensis TaxID=1288410 RepID=UPI0018A9B26A|nr:hypothetical protein [Pseudomonas guariconensis]MBF8743606.1 hypothetical protein [Pseudomonas guariconensis]MBF8752994.1 hypothetical protein [Pseudomonas guariconensis]MBF8794483.1 hypothetical protein [Pseudomonas monteilii]